MIIYVAGAIRPKNGKTMQENIAVAKDIALELWKDRFAVVCPHANSDLPIELADKEVEPELWLRGDLEILARCDAVVVCPDSELSQGTQGEIEYAHQRGIPVYYYPDKPKPHVTETARPQQSHGFIDIVMRMYRVHLDKNADYSPANIMGAGEIGLMTRVWDKVARLMNLMGFKIDVSSTRFQQPEKPKCESVDDTVLDLSVYAIIWQLYRRGVWGK